MVERAPGAERQPWVAYTVELTPGQRVKLPGGIVRTVERVVDTGYLNYRNEPILGVLYAEGRTEQWSEGNSCLADTVWVLAEVES